MSDFADSYLGRLRQRIGHDLVLCPGAQVVVVRGDGRVLVQRRTDTGAWEIPSGAAEPGQSFRDIAVTELSEEAGLRVTAADLVPFATFSDPVRHLLVYPNGDRVHAFALCFWVRLDDSAPIDTAEAVAHRWVAADDVPHPVHPPTVRVLAMYREHRTTGKFIAD